MKLSVNGWKIGKWLLVTCILFSPIVGFNDILDTFRALARSSTISGSPITRIMRDCLICLFYFYFLCWGFLSERIRLKKNTDSVIIIALFMACLGSIVLSVVYSFAIMDVPLKVIIIGIKTFLYLPLYVVAYIFLKEYPPALPAIRRSICFVLSLQLFLGLVQIIFMPPVFGHSRLGSLPVGTFTHYLIYGAFLNTFVFAHLFVRNFKLPKILFAGTVFMILACGSRAAVIIMTFLVLVWLIKVYRRRPEAVGALLCTVPLAIMVLVAILPALSGRESRTKVGLTQDKRGLIWANYLGRDLNLGQIALGSGVGLTSNAVGAIYGPDAFKGQFAADSLHLAIIAQYGFMGLLLLYLAMTALLYKLYGMIGILVSLMIWAFGMATNFWEIYPANMLIPIMLAFHTSRKLQSYYSEHKF